MKLLVISLLLFFSQSIFAATVQVERKYNDLMTGKEFRISSKDKNYVFMVLNIDCPCSVPLFNHIEELNKKFKNFQVVGVHGNNEKSDEDIKKFYADHRITFPIISDRDHYITDAIGANKTPHFAIIQKGKVEFSGGAIDSRSMENAKKLYVANVLEDLTNGKTPRWRDAKTLGCILPR